MGEVVTISFLVFGLNRGSYVVIDMLNEIKILVSSLLHEL